MRHTAVFFLAATMVAIATQADAQGRRGAGSDRQEAARAQGVPPGQLPPPNECRVWYDNRPPGRQPAATNCRQAQAIAARDRSARVIYGENVYWTRSGAPERDLWGDYDNDRAVRRDGRVRDPRITGGVIGDRRDTYGRGRDTLGRTAPAFQNGYRDGMTKGREDAEDGDRYDPNRHSWYRSANRGYDDDDYGSRSEYQSRYRQGFEAGYSEGYRIYARR